MIASSAVPGQRIQLAIFGANGRLSNPPENFVWVRSATLDYYGPGRVGPTVEMAAEVERRSPSLDAVRRHPLLHRPAVRVAPGFRVVVKFDDSVNSPTASRPCDNAGMPKRLRKQQDDDDPARSAFRVLEHVIAESEDDTKPRRSKVVPIGSRRRKNPAAVALGRRGGKKSGAARMEKLSAEERRRIASHAARIRWEREKGDSR